MEAYRDPYRSRTVHDYALLLLVAVGFVGWSVAIVPHASARHLSPSMWDGSALLAAVGLVNWVRAARPVPWKPFFENRGYAKWDGLDWFIVQNRPRGRLVDGFLADLQAFYLAIAMRPAIEQGIPVTTLAWEGLPLLLFCSALSCSSSFRGGRSEAWTIRRDLIFRHLIVRETPEDAQRAPSGFTGRPG